MAVLVAMQFATAMSAIFCGMRAAYFKGKCEILEKQRTEAREIYTGVPGGPRH